MPPRYAFLIISPQGDGNERRSVQAVRNMVETFLIISPQGDGNARTDTLPAAVDPNFSNHFPARGWKPPELAARSATL